MAKISISKRIGDFTQGQSEIDPESDFPWNELADAAFEITDNLAKSDFEISLSFVSKEEIQELNKTYRSKDAVTDVLSFPVESTFGETLGDIVICLERAVEQAKLLKHSLKRELSFLFVHGLLHLLGYDHKNKEEENEMFSLQEKILNKNSILRSS